MRRTLSKLEFEPVPETPQLLPRSVYDESAKDARGDSTVLRADDLDADCDPPHARYNEFARVDFGTACVEIAGCDAMRCTCSGLSSDTSLTGVAVN